MPADGISLPSNISGDVGASRTERAALLQRLYDPTRFQKTSPYDLTKGAAAKRLKVRASSWSGVQTMPAM